MDETDLIYDWNAQGERWLPGGRELELDDETLRDGLQSPSVRCPTIAEKVRILHYMAELGIQAANIGLPGAGPQARADVLALAREIRDQSLPIFPNCAARTLQVDIEPIVEAAEVAGIPIEAAVFIGSSPIRQYAEGWTLDSMLRHSVEAVRFAAGQGLPVMYVTEDTTRAHPETLERLYTAAIEAGARRICLADTVGHATPEGVRNLVCFMKGVVARTREDVRIDWHGHNDRGLGLINALTAARAGADRVHGTALGIGERVGNTSIDQLLVNFRLLGWIDRDLTRLADYCDFVSRVTGVPIPATYPVLGSDAFRTATGVHAAAVIKALRKGDEWLANRVYSGVPADYFGRRQIIEIGPMSGQSNVVHWLEAHQVPAEPALVDAIFGACKQANCVLTDKDIQAVVAAWQAQGDVATSHA
ncbi:MAG: 2-isopropylmalate synthase [Chloroflexi bacterium]|nr:2-isopropylmalate synthase [Chloroflexota bacterium]